jgi:hypothetical protein
MNNKAIDRLFAMTPTQGLVKEIVAEALYNETILLQENEELKAKVKRLEDLIESITILNN